MPGILRSLIMITALGASSGYAHATELDDLYSAKAIVTGQGEKNRQSGFRDCLERVLVRVSGDQRLLRKPEMTGLLARAGSFVTRFSYRDRLAGKPVHDEQGTYDRPHDLTCHYEASTLDGVLAQLGSQPWLSRRPTLAIFLDVQRNGPLYRLSPDNPRDQAMRESFIAGGETVVMQVRFPARDAVDAWELGPSDPKLGDMAKAAGADLPVVGRLQWSEADLGWVATWRLAADGVEHRWTVKGVNFDEAFRVAVRGAAQILSGNGTPD